MSEKPPRKRRTMLAVAVLALLMIGAWSWLHARQSRLPKELSVEALAARVGGDPGKLRQQIRGVEQQLTEAQREELHRNLRTVMEDSMDKRLKAYFAAGESERKVLLDRDIDEMRSRMQEMEKRRAEQKGKNAEGGPPPDGNGPPPGAGGPPPGDPGGGPGGPSPGGPGRGPPGPPSRDQRKDWTERRDPDRMARMMSYMTAMRKRAEERGIQLPMPPGPPPGGGGPRP